MLNWRFDSSVVIDFRVAWQELVSVCSRLTDRSF